MPKQVSKDFGTYTQQTKTEVKLKQCIKTYEAVKYKEII